MSNNPQWKSFQPPTLNDTSIIEYKPMSIQNSLTGANYRGANGSSSFSTSSNHFQTDVMKDMANNLFSSSQSNYSNYNMYSSSNNSSSISSRYVSTVLFLIFLTKFIFTLILFLFYQVPNWDIYGE